jgi:LmbE family N-acetylglucosaminyl deacetylase
MKDLKALILAFSTLLTSNIAAQEAATSAEILHELQKLQNTTRVLYLAAHPDDENTRMISWLENDRHMRTAYLSLTRGDGGQNLIGTELGAKLGVLRTQELMQARAIDGGEQFFTRAVDFGYSKTADETFRQWNKDEVLADVVWVIRTYRPDIIITRFPPDARAGHGHHTASAVLALEAFDLAADPKAYKNQLDAVEPWQVKRLFWNHSTWWRQNLDSIAAADDRYTIVDVGSYNQVLGMSCNELASYSRSQHKSQGFGVSVRRGSSKEYLQLLKGEKVKTDISDGIVQGWERYGWKEGDQLMETLVNEFDPLNPSASIASMQELMKGSEMINDDHIRDWFQEELSQLMAQALGLYVEVLATSEYLSSGSSTRLELNMINRSQLKLGYAGVQINEDYFPNELADPTIINNQLTTLSYDVEIADLTSQPYWLKKAYDKMFAVDDQMLIGKPENDPTLDIEVVFSLDGQRLSLKPSVQYKFTDRVEGEVLRPLVLAPPVMINVAESNLVFVDDSKQQLEIEIRCIDGANHKVDLIAEGWEIKPASLEISGEAGDGWKSQVIEVIPTKASLVAPALEFKVDGTLASSLTEIDYPHIDKRVVFEPAAVNLVKLDLVISGERVGYIEGAGDMVPEALEQMGYQVDMLSKEDVLTSDLSIYQAIIAGIRAYNTKDWLPEAQDMLNAYIQDGGNYIVQYNTASRDLKFRDFGPYPFTLSRQRVTEEDADVEFLLPDHAVLNTPNKLTASDFDQWVQERGLYFASEWDEAYAAPIGWHDQGEPTRAGGLLIADKGEGAFIYTGISFFRELPAGVPGAYRLLANLISY